MLLYMRALGSKGMIVEDVREDLESEVDEES